MKKLYKVTLIVTEIIEATSEEDAIEQMSLDGYKFNVEELTD